MRRVALTFDDGPGPDTPALLAALAARGAPAAFFLHGASLRRHGPPPRAYLAAGHELGDHAVHHVPLHRRPVRAAAEAVVLRALARAPMRWWRPPYGGARPRDCERPGAEVIAARVLRAVRPGSIVLLHDGRGDRAQTVAAVPRILDGLAAYGLAPVTLTALFAR